MMKFLASGLAFFALSSAAILDRRVSNISSVQSPPEIVNQTLVAPNVFAAASCTGPVTSTPTRYWLDAQDHTGNARGYAPNLGSDFTYPVYRNVKSAPYNAKGDGSTDDTAALQNALNSDGSGSTRYQRGVTIRPAAVFVPGGTYMISKPVDMRLNTIFVGDPNNMPIFKATSGFSGDALIHGYDNAAGDPTTNFFVTLKNIIIDTTNINKDAAITALGWGVAQACVLTNVNINMPNNSAGHIGIDMSAGSAVTVTDVTFTGGNVGIRVNTQQANFKNLSFKFCTTAIKFVGGHTAVIQGATFNTCGFGVVTTNSGGLGSVVILDSTSINSGAVLTFHDSSNDSGDRNNQIVIENLSHSGTNPIAVDTSGNVKLAAAATVDTWVFGNESPGNYQAGKSSTTTRPTQLLSNGKYFTKAQPTYSQYAADQFVNVKAVSAFPVKGDGSTDDSASLNAILLQNAANCKISYFPYGVYIIQSTLYIPPGSRIVGEAFSVISGKGANFFNPLSPQPVVMVGNPGEVGVAEISDMRFTVEDVLQGATIVQVNMAGSNPGDVGFWNSHVTVGGTADTKVNTVCGSGDTADCKAAFALVHLTSSSSTYIESMWGWVADHSLDGGDPQNIAVGRGLLVEATKPTWLTGTAFEHSTLYNYNFHNAQFVYAGMMQTETAYWQGIGSQQNAPDPWTPLPAYGDPDFSWCLLNDQKCLMGLAANIDGGSNLFLYGAAFWTFFHGEVSTCYTCSATICGAGCITNQARITNTPKALNWFGVNTRCATTILLDGRDNPMEVNNPGGWSPGGVIAGYLQYSAM